MENYLKEALEIVRAQASVRTMDEDEVISMVKNLSEGIKQISEEPNMPGTTSVTEPPVDPKKAIRDKSIICLESGKAFKVLTKRHLAKFGLTPDEYREKWGYAKGLPLVCKSLQRERRKKMKDMKLWERRTKKTD